MASGGSGVIIEVCNPHGVFFDPGELQTLIKFAQREAARAQREGRQLDDRMGFSGQAPPTNDAEHESQAEAVFGVAAVTGLVALSVLTGPLGQLVASAIGAATSLASDDMSDQRRESRSSAGRRDTFVGDAAEAEQRRRRREGQ